MSTSMSEGILTRPTVLTASLPLHGSFFGPRGLVGLLIVLGLLCVFSGAARADSKSAPGSVPESTPGLSVEDTAAGLARQLRCLVCDGQSVAESDSVFAQSIRELIHKKLAEGENSETIQAFLEQRYGAYILYKPPLRPETWVLWFAPWLLLGLGLVLIGRLVYRASSARRTSVRPLSRAVSRGRRKDAS